MAQPTSSSPRRALVVLSGGQDSTTCLFWALQRFDEVYALSFTYGQKHTHEVDIAAEICAEQQVPYEVMDVPLLGQLGSNSLTDTTLEMDADKPPAVAQHLRARAQSLLPQHRRRLCA